MTLANTAWDLQALLQGPLHPRPRQPDQAAHHEALLDGVEPPGAAHARDGPGHPGDLGHVADRRQARVPRRVLHAHADDAVLRPRRQGPRRLRRAEDLPRRRRRADDRGRRRGVRRLPLPRLHDREVPARGHAPGARAGPGQGRQDDGRLRDRRPELRRHRHRRRADGAGGGRHPPADRVLRLDAGLPARCSSSTAGAACRRSSTRCPSRASGCRWAR